MLPPRGLVVLTLASLVTACSGKPVDAANNPSFKDVSDAPAAIQTAAQAVVKIETAGEAATGSFLSADGLLMTNNHVLGVDICPQEGCYVNLTFGFQRHEPKSTPQTVFVVPIAVDAGLDMALVQTYATPGGAKLPTPHYLTLAPRSAAALQGTHVHVVGHPEGRLKKWSSGDVIDSSGDWVTITAYILPGNSGSPMLDDQGNMIGLLHRGPTSQDLVTADSVNEYSVGTASDVLATAKSAPLPSVVRSVGAVATDADVVAHDRVYLNAHVSTAQVSGAPKAVLTSLGEACDAGLARASFESPEDLSSALTPCGEALGWIECRADVATGGFGVCPADASAWAARFQSVNDHWRALNGSLDLGSLTFGIAQLQASKSAGVTAAAAALGAALAAAKPPLDFGLAAYLAAFQVPSYAGTSILDYVRGYAKVPDYQREATSIASALLWLNAGGSLSESDALALLVPLASDPEVDVGAKLYIEEVQYNSGALP